MYLKEVSSTKYEVYMYDWVYTHEDVLMGHLRRKPDEDPENSDTFYWHFYCEQNEIPMNTGFLRRLSEKMSVLNSGGEVRYTG